MHNIFYQPKDRAVEKMDQKEKKVSLKIPEDIHQLVTNYSISNNIDFKEAVIELLKKATNTRNWRRSMTSARYALSNGGLGTPVSLEVAYWALEALSTVDHLPETSNLVKWIYACENIDGGFSSTPGSKTTFIENLYYG